MPYSSLNHGAGNSVVYVGSICKHMDQSNYMHASACLWEWDQQSGELRLTSPSPWPCDRSRVNRDKTIFTSATYKNNLLGTSKVWIKMRRCASVLILTQVYDNQSIRKQDESMRILRHLSYGIQRTAIWSSRNFVFHFTISIIGLLLFFHVCSVEKWRMQCCSN